MKKIVYCLLFFFILSIPGVLLAGIQEQIDDNLLDMSLTQLMRMTVSSVSKKDESIAAAPGAIFVITGEDIRRSGVTSIPEALRLAPGVQVNRLDASKWAVTIRGFNGRFANKLLVLMDGRTIYTPLSAGVFWEVQDYPLDDINRIEVIRGGSGTLWGANAVNGVINIISKKASATQGLLLTAGTGTEEHGFGTLRYGGQLGPKLFYRLYGKGFSRDSFALQDGDQGNDDWKMGQTGFKLDWLKTATETISVHGDYYWGKAGQVSTVADLSSPPYYLRSQTEDVDLEGGNLFFRWQKEINPESNIDCHLYYDYTSRQEYIFTGRRNTIDLDFQHRFSPLLDNSFLWGLGYRFTTDHIKQPAPITVSHKQQSDNLFSGCIQDDISLLQDHLHLIAGVRLEYNDYTGTEIQPTIRIIYNSESGKTFWAAWSRGIRTPCRLEQTIRFDQQVLPPGYLFPGSPASMVVMRGSSDYDAEEVLSYELGFRSQLCKTLFVDLSLFYNDYDKMLSFSYAPPRPPQFDLVATLGNEVDGYGYGAELACTLDVTPSWKLMASYSFMTLNMDANQSDSPVRDFFEDDIPRHQFSLRSWLNLSYNLQLDGWLRYTDDIGSYDLDSYFDLDLRLGWQATENLEFSLVGQNLLDNQHPEYGSSTLLNTEITEMERGVYVKVQWLF